MQKSVKAGLLTALMLVSLGLSVLILHNGELQAASRFRFTKVFEAEDAPEVIEQLRDIVSLSHGAKIKETKTYGDLKVRPSLFKFKKMTKDGDDVVLDIDTDKLQDFLEDTRFAMQEGGKNKIQQFKVGEFNGKPAEFKVIGVVEDGQETGFKLYKVVR